MKKLWSVIGGISGWALGGPIGAVLGWLAAEAMTGAAAQMDKSASDTFKRGGRARPRQTQEGDFQISLLVLSAVVIKADGVVDSRELDYVRARFVALFGKEKANESFRIFKEVVNQNIDTRAVCEQIRRNMAHSGRLQLIHFLFGVAGSDGHTADSELDAIHKIARYLYISDADFESLRATLQPKTNLSSAYRILELSEDAVETEVKKAYRKMAVKYHPDKLEHLGEDVQKAAKEKFIKVQEAYDTICKAKGYV